MSGNELPPPPESRSDSTTFSGVDHMRAVEKARAAGEPLPPSRDPLRSGDSDPFKSAYLNRLQEK